LRRVDPEVGDVETIAGTGRQGYERERILPARSASLSSPWDLCAIEDGVLVAMAGLHQVWLYDPRTESIRPLAGDGTEQRNDGAFELASFAQPSGLAALGKRAFVADSESSSVRALDLETRRVTTLAGGADEPRDLFHFGDEDGAGVGRRFQHPLGLELDSAQIETPLLYVADAYNHKIKLLDPDSGTVSTYAGSGESGFEDGPAESARFHEPSGLSIAGSTLFVADTNNHAIRALDLEQHEVRTLALRDVPVPLAREPRAELDASPLPRLPSTVVHPQLKRRLAVGDATLELHLGLAEGERLAEGAPSQFRVLREGGLVAAKTHHRPDRVRSGRDRARRRRPGLAAHSSALLRPQRCGHVLRALARMARRRRRARRGEAHARARHERVNLRRGASRVPLEQDGRTVRPYHGTYVSSTAFDKLVVLHAGGSRNQPWT
jgi:hypothetical protein